MNQEQLAAIYTAVRNACERSPCQVFGAQGGTAVDTRAFKDLIAAATQALDSLPQSDSSIDEMDIKIATAMSWVRGAHSGPAPRPSVFTALADLIRSQPTARDDEQLVELVVAFGVGWQRNVDASPEGTWSGTWNGAYYALLQLVAKHCLKVHDYCRNHWGRYPRQGNLRHLSFLDAQRIVAALRRPELSIDVGIGETIRIGVPFRSQNDVLQIGKDVFPVPPGSRQVLSLTDPAQLNLTHNSGEATMAWPRSGRVVVLAAERAVRVDSPAATRAPKFFKLVREQVCETHGPAKITAWTCTCGTKNCFHNHRLDSWKPGILSLSSFVERAVASYSGWKTLKTNEFVGGMLAAILSRWGFEGQEDHGKRIRVFDVEFRECPECPKCKEKVWSFPGTTHCSQGHVLPANTPRKTELLIGIDGDQRPWFQAEERCVCPNCKTIYALTEQDLKEATKEKYKLPEQVLTQANERLRRSAASQESDESEECDAPLFRHAKLINQWRQYAYLERFIWCPQCRKHATCLPRQPTWVDVPVTVQIVYLDAPRKDKGNADGANQRDSLAGEQSALDPTTLDDDGDGEACGDDGEADSEDGEWDRDDGGDSDIEPTCLSLEDILIQIEPESSDPK